MSKMCHKEEEGCYPPVQGEQDGVALDVSVDHTLRVQVRQRPQDPLTDCRYLLLVQPEPRRNIIVN